jgi:hypothetical protein
MLLDRLRRAGCRLSAAGRPDRGKQPARVYGLGVASVAMLAKG